jgi:hypothetical protein
MDALLQPIVDWLSQNAWIGVLISIYLLLHTALKGVLDGMDKLRLEHDKTPDTDDNAWEKFHTQFKRVMSILGIAAKYMAGIRVKK